MNEVICLLQASQRPTLPRLKTKYHWRWGDLRPSSGWDRVWTPRQSHEAGERQISGFFKTAMKHNLFSIYGATLIRKVEQLFGVLLISFSTVLMDSNNENNQADRTISTSKLQTLLSFHTWPINEVVFLGSQGNSCFEVGFPLRCLQRLSRPHIATLHCRWRDNRSTGGVFNPVLSY